MSVVVFFTLVPEINDSSCSSIHLLSFLPLPSRKDLTCWISFLGEGARRKNQGYDKQAKERNQKRLSWSTEHWIKTVRGEVMFKLKGTELGEILESMQRGRRNTWSRLHAQAVIRKHEIGKEDIKYFYFSLFCILVLSEKLQWKIKFLFSCLGSKGKFLSTWNHAKMESPGCWNLHGLHTKC